MTLIIYVAVFILIISAIWIWHNLGNINKNKKIVFILIGLLITYILTLIIYNISGNILYPNEEFKKAISSILILIFTGLNSLIVLPYIAKICDKIKEKEIDKIQVRRKIIIIAIIFGVVLCIENAYLKSTQEGIINMYNEVKNAEK